LGKKSWNVYNKDNIERVRRDEAEAKALEEKEERRLQDGESERRLQLLRGERIDTISLGQGAPPAVEGEVKRGHDRKRRKLMGEDDTDRDLRLAKETSAVQPKRPEVVKRVDAPLVDATGHINLFPAYPQHREKNAEAEAEQAKKKREYEDQYTMRLSNAAGFKQSSAIPWYSTTTKEATEQLPGRDVWGNEDSGRKGREKMRESANDPLAAMKQGIKQLREVEKDRRDWVVERAREMREMEPVGESRSSGDRGQERRKGRRRSREKDDDSSSLENFSLDKTSRKRDHVDDLHARPRSHTGHHHRRHHDHRHRHRHRRHDGHEANHGHHSRRRHDHKADEKKGLTRVV
jgi:hypothetical protein